MEKKKDHARQYDINMKLCLTSDLLQTSQKSRWHSESEGRKMMGEKESQSYM